MKLASELKKHINACTSLLALHIHLAWNMSMLEKNDHKKKYS